MNLKDKILTELEKEPKSIEELELITNKKANNIQSRISELRNEGYDISLEVLKIKKYVLVQKDNATIISDFIKDNNLFMCKISLTALAKEISIPLDDIKLAIGKLMVLNKYKIIQYNPDVVLFKKY